jgi:hypothetical protein
VSPDSPKPGDIGREGPAGPPGIYLRETIVVRFPRAETVEEWVERMNRGEKPHCGCGCGTQLMILPRHRSMGLPRYVHGHHSNPLRCGLDKLREQGYKLVGEVATQLGVSGTTLRRMEAEGIIPKAKRIAYARGKDARAYTYAQVRAMVRSKIRERWRHEHPGRWH